MHDPMEAHRIYAHPNLRADAQKVTIQRGALVYCLESVDNGEPLSSIPLKEDGELSALLDEILLGGAVVVDSRGKSIDLGKRIESDGDGGIIQSVPYLFIVKRKT